MTTKATLAVVMMAAPMVLGFSQCKKAEETGAATSAAPTVAPPPQEAVDASAATTNEVATYPNQIPQGGTVRLLRPFQVYQAADPSSKLLTGLSAGTLVDLKASYSNWMMIMWPSGVGQLSPGWIQLPNVNDNRVKLEERDAGRDAAPDAAADAGRDAAADAGGDAGRGDSGRARIPLRRR